MKEDVLAAVQTRRPTGDHYTLIKTRSRLRNRSRSQVEIDVVRDKQIELAVAVVIYESAASVPALAVAANAGSVDHIRQRALANAVTEKLGRASRRESTLNRTVATPVRQ